MPRADYDVVKDLHAVGAVGTYDAAVVTKDDSGKIHVNKDETTTRHGAWGGAGVGALVGILFPPSIIGTAHGGRRHRWRQRPPVEGDVAGRREGVRRGHRRRRGRPRDRRRDDDRGRHREGSLKAQKKVAKELQVDKKDVDEAVQEAAPGDLLSRRRPAGGASASGSRP